MQVECDANYSVGQQFCSSLCFFSRTSYASIIACGMSLSLPVHASFNHLAETNG